VLLPLESTRDLVDEGEAMHHCVSTYALQCELGEYQVYSVRHVRDGRRVATLGLERHGCGWIVDQLKGYANRPPHGVVHRFARSAASRIGRTAEPVSK